MSHRITPPLPSDSQDSSNNDQANERAAVLADLDAVPRHELPNGAARTALEEAIRTGAVDSIYRPFGAREHNLTLAWLPSDRDPRRRVGEWLEAWHVSVLLSQTGLMMRFLDGEDLAVCVEQLVGPRPFDSLNGVNGQIGEEAR